MKQYNLIQCALTALVLVSTSVSAEEKYPASDFKPTVVYQDESVAKDSGSTAPSSKPAAASTSSSSDAQYPATNFEPKVVYSDESYKHSDITPKASSGSNSNSVSVSDSSASAVGAESPAASAKKDEGSIGYLLGLVALLGAGFFLYKKGAFGAANSSAPARSASSNLNAGGLTGVARYVLKASGTGVSRYIEKNVKIAQASASTASATGVAKYLANQASSPKANATGVEKYLKNKG